MNEGPLLDPSREKRWNDLLLSTPAHSFFHTANWAAVLQKTYGYRPLYLACIGDKAFDQLIPMMEVNSPITGRRGVCLPFTDYCDPIVSDTIQFSNITSRMVDIAYARSWRSLEMRGGSGCFPSDVQASASHYRHALDLTPGPERIFSSLHNATRRNIRKALREKVETRVVCSDDSMRSFHRLNVMTRRRHGLLPQPSSFFKNIYDEIISKGLGFVVLAHHSNRVIAANVYFHFGEEVIYKYGASDFDYQHLRANNLIMWEAIRWSCARGYRRLCLGRTEFVHEGLRRFKLAWGAREQTIRYYLYDTVVHDFVANSPGIHPFYRRLFRTFPSPALTVLGHLLYRHMG